ncbi:glycoside hydrolase family 71/99 protein [Spirosoma agri]|uniref:Uncharacterized protein n=1 Tax=Spirosoma agri TaxID=1987381 RepID=A0A6M0IL26_9BACT|nr:hypothetical protein [Spirosoma agri]NEU68854.1 hypothetical protein [Spirosoma agri]
MKWFILSVVWIGITITSFFLPEFDTRNSNVYQSQETGSPIIPPISANWAATDGVGRTLPKRASTGDFKRNKYVGIFYFLLHGQYNDKAVYDISAITRANPTSPKFGPETTWHWWGEPEAGYYKADDPWVIRRNLQLLTLAGVDILFFDVTNGDTYLTVVKKICEISIDMRHKGMPTPYICFVTYTRSAQTVATLYEQIYNQNKYSELWFRWQGKPLILGKIGEMTDTGIRDFFTWRYSWAWTNTRNEPHNWQWLDRTPQNYGWDKDPSVPEQIPVAVASHPFDNSIGKSFRQGRQGVINRNGITNVTQNGLYFDEQWKRALQVNPAVVFVSGWNEWVAQRFINRPDSAAKAKPFKFMGKPMKPGQTFFIDLYNEEYNRDIEPMKGGYTDNYYYQLVANIRRFKGIPAPEQATPARTISIDGKFDEWNQVKPAFFDPADDVLHRNWPRADNKINYLNKTGRNDITSCRVTYDKTNAFFYVKTAQKISAATDKNWMLLFVDADQSIKTGWAGYDYLITHTYKGNKSTVNRWNGKAWTPVATGTFRYTNNELELSVPLSALKQTAGKVKIDFHWADNIQQLNNITEFFTNGDSAPDRRFNYSYVN